MAKLEDRFERLRMCVLMPVYNHGSTVATVLEGILAYTTHVIVVNDGSTDSTTAELEPYMHRIIYIQHDQNRSKGEALRSGFEESRARGFDRVMTIDADGQHFPDDIPFMLSAAENCPDALIMGCRTLSEANAPGASTFGNRFSNFWFKIISGKQLSDTQSGFRIYPLHLMRNIQFFGSRYELESEILIKLTWRDIPIVQVPIRVYYAPGDERITHFKKFKDFMRITGLNTLLLICALFYWLPRRAINNLKKKNLKDILKQEVLTTDHSNARLSAAAMLGVFFGVAPIWGFQMIVIVALCVLLRLNKVIALTVAQISLPPFIPFILFISYKIGIGVVGLFSDISTGDIPFSQDLNMDMISHGIAYYVFGAVILGTLLALITGISSYCLLKMVRRDRTYSSLTMQTSDRR